MLNIIDPALLISSRFEQNLFFDDTTHTWLSQLRPGGPRDVIKYTGLYLASDTSPTYGSLGTSNGLITGTINNGVVSATSNWSVGIYQESSNVHMIHLIDDGSAGEGLYNWGSNDSLTLYESSNGSSWTQVKVYQPLIRQPVPGQDAYVITIICDTTKRYLKLNADSGGLKSKSGIALNISGIRTYGTSTPTQSSGSRGNLIVAQVKTGQTVGWAHPTTSYVSNIGNQSNVL